MPNLILTNKNAPGIIAKMAAKMFADKVQFVKSIDKEDFGTFSGKDGYQAGDTVQIAKPARFNMNSGADITSAIQDVKEEKVSLALTNQRNVAIALTSAEMATDMALKSWAKRVLDPAMVTLSNGVEQECLTFAKNNVGNYVGTPGNTIFDTDTMLAANQKQIEFLMPQDDQDYALLNPAATRSASNARKGLFQASDEIASQYRNGYIGQADGMTYLRNNLLPLHINGTATGSLTVTASPTEGASTINLTGTGTQTITQGTVLTFAGAFAVHPVTKQSLGYLQQFVVTANATASGGAYTGVQVYPSFSTAASGSTQTITALPASSAVTTIVTGAANQSTVQNLAFHKSAFRFVSAPLIMPDGVDFVAQETVDGMTVRVLRDYLPQTDKLILRVDILYGIAAVRPEWACRIGA